MQNILRIFRCNDSNVRCRSRVLTALIFNLSYLTGSKRKTKLRNPQEPSYTYSDHKHEHGNCHINVEHCTAEKLGRYYVRGRLPLTTALRFNRKLHVHIECKWWAIYFLPYSSNSRPIEFSDASILSINLAIGYIGNGLFSYHCSFVSLVFRVVVASCIDGVIDA